MTSKKEQLLTYELASELFSYDPQGFLRWKKPRNKTKKVDQIVGGRRKDGRQQVMLQLEGKPYLFLVYRIIWLLHHGHWPSKTIDHVNGNPQEDRIENLRDISQGANNENKQKSQSNNKLQTLGVCMHKTTGKFRATINKHNKQHHLGLFESQEDALVAYKNAKDILHIGPEDLNEKGTK